MARGISVVSSLIRGQFLKKALWSFQVVPWLDMRHGDGERGSSKSETGWQCGEKSRNTMAHPSLSGETCRRQTHRARTCIPSTLWLRQVQVYIFSSVSNWSSCRHWSWWCGAAPPEGQRWRGVFLSQGMGGELGLPGERGSWWNNSWLCESRCLGSSRDLIHMKYVWPTGHILSLWVLCVDKVLRGERMWVPV